MADILDNELEEGLTKAKEKPLNFALICKGPSPLKMIVRKKKIKETEVKQIKQAFKGSEIIRGVIQRNGAEVILQVVGVEEPGIKPARIREFLAEQAGVTVKPQWQMVQILPEVSDEEDPTSTHSTLTKKQPTQSTTGADGYEILPKKEPSPATTGNEYSVMAKEPQTGPVYSEMTKKDQPIQTTADNYAVMTPKQPGPVQAASPQPAVTKGEKVLSALNEARPKVKKACELRPEYQDQLQGMVAAIEEDLRQNKADMAMSRFRELVALLSSVLKDRGAVSEADRTDRLVTLQRSRVDWDSARKQLHSQLERVAKAVIEECSDPEEYDQAEVAAQVKQLNKLMDRLDTRLIDVLDKALNAEKLDERNALERQASQIVNEYLKVLDDEKLVRQIDDSGLLPVSIRKSMGDFLTELSNRLAT